MIHESSGQTTATLPVDLKSIDDFHYLEEFAKGDSELEAILKAQTLGIVTESSSHALLATSSNLRPPTEPYYGGGDTNQDIDYFYDPFGFLWEPIDFALMTTIVITGQRLEPISNFDYIPVSLWEYTALNGGGGSPGGPCSTTEAAGQKVDWGFVKTSEGYKDHGYIVYDKKGNVAEHSGVTIASGFDLGVHSAADVDKIGLSADTATALKRYVGLQGVTAEAYLYTHTAVYITPEEGELINSWAHSEALIRMVTGYDNATSAGSFYQLPSSVQTALADATFQYGSLRYTGNADMNSLWQHAIAKDWTAAIADLRHAAANSPYPDRRTREADLLEAALNSGVIHNGSVC
jgi:hypothetical protein